MKDDRITQEAIRLPSDKNQSKRICPISGVSLDIAIRQGDFLDESGAEFYYHNHRDIFEKKLSIFSSQKSVGSDMQVQFSEIATLIRTIFTEKYPDIMNRKEVFAEGGNNAFRKSEMTICAINSEMRMALERQAEASESKGVSAMDLLNRKIKSIPCLVEPFLQKTGLAAIAGSSDAGKSCFLRHLCTCVVSGKSDFLGFPIHAEHKRAIYVSTEDDETAIAYLLHKQNEDMQLEPNQLQEFQFIFDTEDVLQTLDESLSKHPADIVCIDAFTDLYCRSMNEANQVRGFLNGYSQLAQKHQCLILFLHHCGKRTEELVPSKNHLLGSQSFEAKMRLVLELRSDVADKNLKHLCIVKGNYLPASAKNESFQLQFTENMTFIDTGERIPIENLAKANDGGRQRYERIKEYQSQGFSMSEIAEKVGFKSKGSVSKIIQKFEKQDSVSQAFPQETTETIEETPQKNDEKLPF